MKKTPLYDNHVKLGAKMIEFGGWSMPVYYTTVIDEHNNTRHNATLFDTCHMGEFIIEGKDSFPFIQNLITNDLNKLQNGAAFYSAICKENGGVIDDLIVYRFSQIKFMLVVNASNIEKDFKWLLNQKKFFENTLILNKSEEMAKLDLQGPRSEETLQRLTDIELKDLKRFHFIEADVDGIPTIISRTGYTGEDGFELYFSSEMASKQWDKLLDTGKDLGLKPAGLGSRDTLRIEVCYPLYGHELTEDITPLESGIGFIVNFDKDFIGKEILQDERLKRKIVAFEMIDRSIPRSDYEVFKDDKKIGSVTSGTFSPTLKKPIGLAMLKIEETKIGNEIEIKIRDRFYKAKVVERPFYKYGGKK